MNQQITVYILAYNRPEYLNDCLSSLSKQTFRDFHIVVLDNASQTDLISVVRQYDNLDIDYIRHPYNIESIGNFSHAWNAEKNTPYFMIFHDDDIMHPEFLERGLKIMNHSSNPAWVGFDALFFDGCPPPFPSIESDVPLHLSGAELAYRLITGTSNVVFSSVIYRSDLIKTVDLKKLISEHSIICDRPLLFALAQNHRCFLSSLRLVLYRCHAAQDSKNGPLNEDNVFSLFLTYRQVLQTIWSKRVEFAFYSWSAFTLREVFYAWPIQNCSTLSEYLCKARGIGVYNDRFLILFNLYKTRLRFRKVVVLLKQALTKLGSGHLN